MATSFIGRPGVILARLFCIAVAATAIGWAIVVVPIFWSEATISLAATHIIAGDVYNPEIMEVLEADLEHNYGSALRSSILSKAAIIRLRDAENAIAKGDRKVIDGSLNTLDQAVDDAVTNAPSDPYQWLVIFWLENTRSGFRPEHLRYLQMSYELGPHEGWIAIKRNRLALATYSELPMDLAQEAIAEFLGLVRSELYAEAADIIAGPAWPIRHVLLARLKDFKEFDRRQFAKALYARNLDDVPIPGIQEQPLRPFR